jgi:hypothetical protein
VPTREELETMLREMLERHGEHAAFNRAMKASAAFADPGEVDGTGPAHRVLHGEHDLESFLADVYAAYSPVGPDGPIILYGLGGRRHVVAPKQKRIGSEHPGYHPHWLRAVWAYARARGRVPGPSSTRRDG